MPHSRAELAVCVTTLLAINITLLLTIFTDPYRQKI
jgi:hypothetical protein